MTGTNSRSDPSTDLVPESYEVVYQRVLDIVTYVRSSLPELFDKSSGSSSTSNETEVKTVLASLQNEWDKDVVHTSGLNAILSAGIINTVSPKYDAAVEQWEEDHGLSEEDWGVSGVVAWHSILPKSKTSPLSRDLAVASIGVVDLLNSLMWDDDMLHLSVLDQFRIVSPHFDRYFGCFGFLLTYTYIQVVDNEIVPPFMISDV